jgi:putative flavoprotein involved in K+ transport
MFNSVGGISSTHLGLVYLGLEFQRSFASNTLRGVSQDALVVLAPLVAWIRDAPAAIGLSTPVRTTLQASNCGARPR